MSDTNPGPRRVPERPVPDDDTAVRLLRLAGHRPPVPAADAAIVKEAARIEWRRAVWRNRRRKLAWRTTGGLLAAAALILLVVGSGLRRDVTSRRSEPVATVTVVDGGPATTLEVGAELGPGAVVETAGFEGSQSGRDARAPGGGAAPDRVALRLAGGPSLRLDVGSALRLRSPLEVELLAGAVYVDSRGHALEVRTDLGTVTNAGTRFELRLLPADDGALRVRVRDGEVHVTVKQGDKHPVDAGQQVVVRADGTLERPADVEPYDPEWCWAASVWPPMDVDEPTALEVLEWVACESGRRLRFAEGVDPAALDVLLRGSKLSCALEDCIDLAFLALGRPPGQPLRHRIADGELWIELGDPTENVR